MAAGPLLPWQGRLRHRYSISSNTAINAVKCPGLLIELTHAERWIPSADPPVPFLSCFLEGGSCRVYFLDCSNDRWRSVTDRFLVFPVCRPSRATCQTTSSKTSHLNRSARFSPLDSFCLFNPRCQRSPKICKRFSINCGPPSLLPRVQITSIQTELFLTA